MLSNGWHLVHSCYHRHMISYGTWWPCEHGRQAPCGHGTYGHSVVTACTQHTGLVTLWMSHQVDGHHTAHSTGLMGTEYAHCVRYTWSPCGHCVNTAHTVTVWPQYTNMVPTWCLQLLCGHGIRTPCPHCVYCHHVAMVHRYHAHTTCMVAMWPRYTHTMPTLCPLGIDTVATWEQRLVILHLNQWHPGYPPLALALLCQL